MSTTIFLLSPASCTGKRARMLMRPAAAFPLALRVRGPAGAPLGEVFAFVSGLYFRGKLAYATRFAAPPAGVAGVLVITPDRGLVAPETHVTVADLEAMAGVDIHLDNAAYRAPLTSSARDHAAALPVDATVVLLGSVATAKYADVLGDAYGDRLRFPAEFAGRGDMSRGGLLLRCADDGRELTYVRIGDAPRHGPRPPRLEPRRRARTRNGA